jgi:hypothetical protein
MSMRLARKKQSSRTGARLRGTTRLLCAAGIAATGLGALAATAPARAATSPGAAAQAEWRPVYSTHGGASKEFDGITAPARNDAWAVGDTNVTGVKFQTPFLAHWNGKTWSTMTTIRAAAGLNFGIPGWGSAPAYSTSPGNVWFFGRNQAKETLRTPAVAALVYNGKAWHIQRLPSDFAIPLAVLGPKDVWGETLKSYLYDTGDSTVLTHWNGSTWSHVIVKGIGPVASAAGGHAWILTMDAVPEHVSGWVPAGPPLVYRTSGAALQDVGAPAGAKILSGGIGAAPDGRLWIVTAGNVYSRSGNTGTVYTWSGKRWTSTAFPLKTVPGFGGSLNYDGKNGFWNDTEHWTGSGWQSIIQSKQLATFNSTGGIAGPIPGTHSLWTAGYIPRAGKTILGYPTNAVIAVYGPLP